MVLGPACRGPQGRVPARAPRSHLLPRPPCWEGLPLFVFQGGLCSSACTPHLGGRNQLSSLGSWSPGADWQEVTLPWRPQPGLVQGQHHAVRGSWPVVVSSARPQGGFSGGQHTLCAPPGQGQPRLFPGQQGDGRPGTGVSRPGQPACRATPQSSEPKVSAWPLGVCPFMTRSPDLDCSLPSQVARAPTWATATQGVVAGDRRDGAVSGQAPTPTRPPAAPRLSTSSHTFPVSPPGHSAPGEGEPHRLSPGEPAASCALGNHGSCVCSVVPGL